jgi:hypothetical protein
MAFAVLHGVGLDPGLGIAFRDFPSAFCLCPSTAGRSRGLGDSRIEALLVRFLPALPISLLIPVALLAVFPSAMGHTASYEDIAGSVTEVEIHSSAVASADAFGGAVDLYELYEILLGGNLDLGGASPYDLYAFDDLVWTDYYISAAYRANLASRYAANVPEPSTALLLACGLLGLATRRRQVRG